MRLFSYTNIKQQNCYENIPPLVEHRGASHQAPENTLPSYRLAFKEGADRVEGDFWLTKDEEIICLNHPTTARTAPHQPILDVRTSRLDELRGHDVGLWKAMEYKNTGIPTLAQILKELPSNVILYVEITQDDSQILSTMFKAAKQCGVGLDRLILISFSEDIVQHAKQ